MQPTGPRQARQRPHGDLAISQSEQSGFALASPYPLVLAYKAHCYNIPFVLLQILQSVSYGVRDCLVAKRAVGRE